MANREMRWLRVIRRALRRFARWLDHLFGGGPKQPDQIRVNVLPDRGSFSVGEMVTGKVLLRRGAAEKSVTQLSLAVSFLEPDHPDEVQAPPMIIKLADSVEIDPSEVVAVSFSFRMPNDARITEDEEGAGRLGAGCRIIATCQTRFGRPLEGSDIIHVKMRPEIRALLVGFAACGFVRKREASELTKNTVRRHYTVPGRLSEWLGSATLAVEANDERVQGTLTLSRRPGTFSEKIRETFGTADTQTVPINIPCAELLTSAGKPNSDGAVPHIEHALDESMLVGDTARSRLMRPSYGPPEEMLLHPAQSADTEPEMLLQPATKPGEPE